MLDVPALHGSIGQPSNETIDIIGEKPPYPTYPVLDEAHKPHAWLRFLSPISADFDRIQALRQSDATKFKEVKLNYIQNIKDIIAGEGDIIDFAAQAEALKAYGLSAAGRSLVVSTVMDIPALLMITEHVEGVRMDEWLNSEAVDYTQRQQLASHVLSSLSTYCRDIMEQKAQGKAVDLYPDISRPAQFIVNSGLQAILIDGVGEFYFAGTDALAVGAGYFAFHRGLMDQGKELLAHASNDTHRQVLDDYKAVMALDLPHVASMAHTMACEYEEVICDL